MRRAREKTKYRLQRESDTGRQGKVAMTMMTFRSGALHTKEEQRIERADDDAHTTEKARNEYKTTVSSPFVHSPRCVHNL